MALRIALTHAFCWPEVRRGGERYLHELGGALARRGHRVTILAGARRWSAAQEDGTRVVRIGRRDGRVDVAQAAFARRVLPLLAAGRYDVVHSFGPRDAIASLRAARLHPGRRTVYTCLGLPIRSSWDRQGPHHRRVVEGVDVYGCLSRHARDLLQESYGREGALTPGGVRLDRFTPAEREPEPTLLYSGALDEPRKGVATLLEAVAILARREPRVRLWLSGPGGAGRLLAAAPAEAQRRTEVLGVGSVHDQPRRYARSWATVLPSTNEAFGLVLVESLAAGTPIVGADHASLPELVEPGSGEIAAAEDAVSLADACERALTLARDPSTVERCREAARRHDWDASVAPRVEALYLGSSRDGLP